MFAESTVDGRFTRSASGFLARLYEGQHCFLVHWRELPASVPDTESRPARSLILPSRTFFIGHVFEPALTDLRSCGVYCGPSLPTCQSRARAPLRYRSEGAFPDRPHSPARDDGCGEAQRVVKVDLLMLWE